MQTVTRITAGGAAAGAAPGPDAADKAAFPTTLRGAMTPRDGNTSPPTNGRFLPDDTNAAAPAPTAPSDTSPSPVTAAAEDGAKTAAVEMTPSPKAPAISSALHDIAASRKAAQTDAAPRDRDAVAENEAAPSIAAGRVMSVQSIKQTKPPADTALELDTNRDSQIDPNTAAIATASAAEQLVVPTPPPVTPPGSPGNSNPVAAAATQHAREVVLDRPAASPAWGLLGKVTAGDAAPADAGETSAEPPLPASPAVPVSAGGDATDAARASAGPAAFAAAAPPMQSAPDLAVPSAPALVAPGGQATLPPTVAAASDTAASAPFNLNIAAAPGSVQFGPELGERVLWLIRDGLHEARLQLNPRELGPVEVRLSVGDGAAQVNFSTQHAGTAAAVQQSLPQLRDLLAQQGLQLGQATVSHQPAGDGQAAQQQTQTSASRPDWERQHGDDIEDGLPMPTARVVGHGLVDAYA